LAPIDDVGWNIVSHENQDAAGEERTVQPEPISSQYRNEAERLKDDKGDR
jgi:hypothetical protein